MIGGWGAGGWGAGALERFLVKYFVFKKSCKVFGEIFCNFVIVIVIVIVILFIRPRKRDRRLGGFFGEAGAKGAKRRKTKRKQLRKRGFT